MSEAISLAEEQERRLGDPDVGGYFAAGEDPRLLFRAKPAFDGAVASGNGTAAMNLIELGALTGESRWSERAEAVLLAFGDGVTRGPFGHVTLVRALARRQDRPSPARKREPAPSSPPGASAVEALEDEAREAVEVDGRLGRGEDEVWKPFTIDLQVRPGFHVNPNPVEDAALVATTVTGVRGSVRNVVYPRTQAGEPTEPGVPGYRGRVRIEGEIEHRGGGAAMLELVYQACDEARCLPPVTRLVRLR